jgi:hypothetical protein
MLTFRLFDAVDPINNRALFDTSMLDFLRLLDGSGLLTKECDHDR